MNIDWAFFDIFMLPLFSLFLVVSCGFFVLARPSFLLIFLVPPTTFVDSPLH